MSDQQTIHWPNREQHPSVRTTDPDTCVEPSEPKMSAGRWEVLRQHGVHAEGLTDFEVAALVNRQQTSAGKRRGELMHAGLIVATTERRPSPSGSPATVYRITPQGVAYLRDRTEES